MYVRWRGVDIMYVLWRGVLQVVSLTPMATLTSMLLLTVDLNRAPTNHNGGRQVLRAIFFLDKHNICV